MVGANRKNRKIRQRNNRPKQGHKQFLKTKVGSKVSSQKTLWATNVKKTERTVISIWACP